MEPGPLNKYCHECHKSTKHVPIIGTKLLTCMVCGKTQPNTQAVGNIQLLADRRTP